MNEAGRFILAKNVQFISVNSIHDRTKNNFEYDENDVIITHAQTRKSSKVVGQDAAALLKEFQTPKSWAEVIFNLSKLNNKNPQQLAEEAFSLLMEMKQDGFLIPYKEIEESGKDHFIINDHFKQYKVINKYQDYEDTEVWQVTDSSGNKCALKILKLARDDQVSTMFKNESKVLLKLDGRVNPKLVEEGVEAGIHYLVTEWCEGLTCDMVAAKYRNYNFRNNTIKILDLCLAILHAYDHLHSQGILHSDIHPRNVLISEKGTVKIIDYGVSASKEKDQRMVRRGVGFYYEPEFADAYLNEKPSPPATEKGEQYSLAALLYFLITGRHYFNFSFESEKLYKQILDETPVSLRTHDLNLPEELDKIFSVALSKDVAERFFSLQEFARALTDIRNNIFSYNDFFKIGKEDAEEQFIQFLVRKFGWDSRLIQEGLSVAPTCSVNYGAAGISYMFYRIACTRQKAEFLHLADVWANRASLYKIGAQQAFYSPEIDISEETVGRRSIYHSPTGVYLVQALIGNCRNDMHSVNQALHGFFNAANESCDKIDLALGKSSLLIACSILIQELKSRENFNVQSITRFANKIVDEIWQQLDEYPDLNLPNPVNYFGIAHGWAGLLYSTVLWCRASQQELPANFENRVGQLLSVSIKNENKIVWPISLSEKKWWPGWCHGSAGHVFLWSLLYKHLKEEKFLLIAEKSAKELFDNLPQINSSLCCGMAGQAYSLLDLYNLTGEKDYLQQAQKINQKILGSLSSSDLRNNSLYKGEVGIGVLFCESQAPQFARMPLFQ